MDDGTKEDDVLKTIMRISRLMLREVVLSIRLTVAVATSKNHGIKLNKLKIMKIYL